MGTDKNNGKETKGFAGFSDLVSDVTVEPESQKSAAKRTAEPNRETQAPAPVSTTTSAYQAPVSTSSGGGKGWVWGIVGVVVVFGLISANSGSSKSGQSSSSNYSAPATAPAYEPPAPSNVEQMPPVGSGMTLSNNQIRYCVSEDIRMTAMKDLINSYSSHEVDQFNAAVADYNSRCSSYRYKRGALESVTAEVQSNRYALTQEAQNQVMAWRRSAPAQRAPDPVYMPPTPSVPSYSAQPSYPGVPAIDQNEMNRLQDESRRYMAGYQAATAACGNVPSDMSRMDTWMECMRSRGY